MAQSNSLHGFPDMTQRFATVAVFCLVSLCCTSKVEDPGRMLNAGTEFRDCDDCPLMVVIPSGSFMMGAPTDEPRAGGDEQPQHEVRIAKAFAVGKFELTRGEYAPFVEATGWSSTGGCYYRTGPVPENDPERHWQNSGYPQDDSHPAVCVSRNDAQAFVTWLSAKTGKAYRLLSESEWEYVARAGTISARYWGDSEHDGCAYANGADLTGESDLEGWETADCEDGHTYTAAVGSFKPNDFGVHDTLGNVAEWVADCWNDTYEDAPTGGSAWMSGDCARPILRGASWHDDPRFLRSANRYGFYAAGPDSADARYRNFGFRVAREL